MLWSNGPKDKDKDKDKDNKLVPDDKLFPVIVLIVGGMVIGAGAMLLLVVSKVARLLFGEGWQ